MSIQTIFGNGKYNWINIDTDSTDNLADFYEKYHIDDEVIAYSIDRNERAHFEYDQKSNTFVIVFNVLIKGKWITIMRQYQWFL